jgi:hypothetical protein
MGTLELSAVVGLLVLIFPCLHSLVAFGSITRGVIVQGLVAPIYGSSIDATLDFMSYA